jgi:hypothetical protein
MYDPPDCHQVAAIGVCKRLLNELLHQKDRQAVACKRAGDIKGAAMALAKSQAYQDAADASATLHAYVADLANYAAWCDRHDFKPMPATPEVVGAYLAAAGEGHALPTLRHRVTAIARACGVAGHPLDTKHPAIRETLRGIGRKHGA